MDSLKTRTKVRKAVGVGLVVATGISMAPVAHAEAVQTGIVNTEVSSADGSVVLTGPEGAEFYKNTTSGKTWYAEGGKFTLTVDPLKFSGVTVEVNGSVVIENAAVTEGDSTFELDISGDAEVRVTAGNLVTEPEGGSEGGSEGGGESEPEEGSESPSEETAPEVDETEYPYLEDTVTTSITVGIDDEAPASSGLTEGSIDEVEGTTYVAGDTKLIVEALDDGSGTKGIEYQVKDGEGWTTVQELSSGEAFTPTSEGTYRVVLTDNLGNSDVRTFEQLFGTSSKVGIEDPDDQKSSISVTVDGSSSFGSWLPGRVDQGSDDRKSYPVAITLKKSGGIHLGDTIRVNGKKVNPDSSTNDAGDTVYTLDIKDIALADDGEYNFEVQSRYIFGKSTDRDFTVKVDYAKPVIEGASLTGDYVIDGGKIYVKGAAYFNASAVDIESGVDKIRVLRENSGGESEEVDITTSGDSFRFRLNQGIDYEVEVTDKVGNVTTRSLTELDLGSNDVVYDSDPPVIVQTDGIEADYTSGSGDEWFKDEETFTFSIADKNLKNIELNVNGQISTPKINDDGVYSIDLSDYTAVDGSRYDITVKASDRALNSSSISRTVFVDSDAPKDIKATIEGSYKNREFGLFSTESLLVHAKANDGSGVGIEGYRLVDAKSGEVVKTSEDGNISLGSGEFALVAYDYLGNTSAPVTLKDALGVHSKRIFIDNTKPEVNVTRGNPVHGNWYSDDQKYDVEFVDDQALYSGTVTVNGKEVTSFTSDSVETSRSLSFNTSEATASEDGSYEILVKGIDAAGNSVSWNETIRIDSHAPKIESFTFTDQGFQEGNSISNSDEYGFFFQSATKVTIKVSDEAPSSGIKEVQYTLRNGNGSVHSSGTAQVTGNSATVTIPNNFKGYIDAYAVDNVGHESSTQHPSGVITEDRNWYINTSDVSISLEDPGHSDDKGQYLYRTDVTAAVSIEQGVAGIRNVEWGIGDETLGNASVSPEGNLKGSNFNVVEKDKNLVLNVSGSLPVNGNSNDMRLWVRVTDRAGHSSSEEETVSIDKDAPLIDVTYNQTNDSTFYNSDRVATITIDERNFNPEDVQLSGDYGTLGSWSRSGDVWTNTITFADEIDYQWGLEYTDMAGNKGIGYSSESFTIDKTAPQLSVDFDNNAVNNGNFYNGPRTAVVEIIDRNFDPELVDFQGDGVLGGWSTSGDRHTATVRFDEDGEYAFSVSTRDKADNESTVHEEESFIIDQTNPELEIEGVSKGVSYKKDVGFTVKASDKYIDVENSTVTLVGRENGRVSLDGSFDEETGRFVMDNFPNEEENDDFYKITARVVDMAGNVEESEVDFTVNRFGSNFTFLNVDFNGEYFQELPDDVVMVQDSVDRLGLNGFDVTVLQNGSPTELPDNAWKVTESGGEDSRWTYTVRVNKEHFTDDAKFQVQTFSKAEDGTEESSMDQEYAFVIDATDPDIYISGIESGRTYSNANMEAVVEVRDLAGVETISVTVNDEPVEFTEEGGIYRVPLKVKAEYQDLKVTVVDRAGNVGVQEVSGFYLASNSFEALIHATWFKVLMWLLGILVLLGGVLIGRRVYLNRKEEKEAEEARQRALAVSTTGSGGRTSGNMSVDAAPLVGEEGVADSVEGDAEGPQHASSSEDDIPTDVETEDESQTSFVEEDDDKTGFFDQGR